MSGLTKLGQQARQAVVRALAPAEPIVFVTSPDPKAAARGAIPTCAAGALLLTLALPAMWICLHVMVQAIRGSSNLIQPLLFTALAVPAAALGGYLCSAPLSAWRRARDSVILITDRRLLLISISRGTADMLPASSIIGVECKQVERGFGTLEIRHEARGDEAETVLSGVDNAVEAELAIRRLSLDNSTAIITPVL